SARTAARRVEITMIPKPPYARDLTLEQEIAEFEKLKPRLKEVWNVLTMREEEPHTSVIVPSLTLDQSELRTLPGASFYEERLLFLLIRLRNPRARLVYVTSQAVHPIILEYYLQFLAGIPASHARSRLTLLCADDASPRSLTEKILERPRLVGRIRAGRIGPHPAVPTRFTSPPLPLPLHLDDARAKARRAPRHPPERLRPEPPAPRDEVGEPEGLQGGGHRPSPRHRGPPHAARGRGGAARAPRKSPHAPQGGREAQRELLRRGQRDLPLPRSGGRQRLQGRAPARGVLRAHGDAGGLLRQVRADGRDRRGVRRREGEALPELAAPDQPPRGVDRHLDPR